MGQTPSVLGFGVFIQKWKPFQSALKLTSYHRNSPGNPGWEVKAFVCQPLGREALALAVPVLAIPSPASTLLESHLPFAFSDHAM